MATRWSDPNSFLGDSIYLGEGGRSRLAEQSSESGGGVWQLRDPCSPASSRSSFSSLVFQCQYIRSEQRWQQVGKLLPDMDSSGGTGFE
nr:hypothetical protein Itr_chr12CG20620 [Ipomoea trifida]